MKRQAARSETSLSVDVEVDKPKRRTRLGKRRRTLSKADRPWASSPIPLEGEDPSSYSFWTSQTAIAAYIFLSLSLIRGDTRFLHGATLVILAQIWIVLRRWARFLSGLGILQECIDVSRGYIKLFRRHAMAFVDQEKGHPMRRVTGAMVLYQRNLQFQFLSWYLQKRNKVMKRKAAETHQQSKRHLDTG